MKKSKWWFMVLAMALLLTAPVMTGCSLLQPLLSGPLLKQVQIPAEKFEGDGYKQQRGNAQNDWTVHLRAGESIDKNFSVPPGATKLWVSVRYSNDNGSPISERVTLAVGAEFIGSFTAGSTGSGGNGWNVFSESLKIGPANVESGGDDRILYLVISGGDGYGIEIDSVTLYFY
ncbi:MAG: hypothetical protein NTY81_01080 [Candidatus Staskawiczbacteria bacterium]|nr:hypothetical protein [Candidatus Staskawiczbacteria bacterium]